ncbi:hypothetical protein WJX73_000133 [Symbiochloris irregularis]|uniref:Ubiquitin carboxyl-terminal hydrolase n=1 Tax=Symbiochloris irregularis TaxID=706552 RepID=A0AAW1PIH5_9CHLO
MAKSNLDFLYTAAPVEQRRIAFVPARHTEASVVPEGLDIIWLTPRQDINSMAPGSAERVKENGHFSKKQRVDEAAVPLQLQWSHLYRKSPGLHNLANTCYMNSVLQCLTHTPPLAEAFLSGREWRSSDPSDPLYITQQHIRKALQLQGPGKSIGVLMPSAHANTLRRVCSRFRKGRHEDAHEYLMNLLDVMHESMVKAQNGGKMPAPSASGAQPSSLIHHIFGGRMRNQVKCTECGYESNRSDLFIDLSLDIDHASTITRALQRYTAPEILDGANKYWCKRHRAKMRARKCMTIDIGPPVLILQLKRFAFAGFGLKGMSSKIHRKVDFDTLLDLGPFMSNRRAGQQLYELYSVIVHVGHSLHAGHYFCFVRASDGLWHRMDDTHVASVAERIVLSQSAYMLFYIRKSPPAASISSPEASSNPTTQSTAEAKSNHSASHNNRQAAGAEAGTSDSSLRKRRASNAAAGASDSDTGQQGKRRRASLLGPLSNGTTTTPLAAAVANGVLQNGRLHAAPGSAPLMTTRLENGLAGGGTAGRRPAMQRTHSAELSDGVSPGKLQRMLLNNLMGNHSSSDGSDSSPRPSSEAKLPPRRPSSLRPLGPTFEAPQGPSESCDPPHTRSQTDGKAQSDAASSSSSSSSSEEGLSQSEDTPSSESASEEDDVASELEVTDTSAVSAPDWPLDGPQSASAGAAAERDTERLRSAAGPASAPAKLAPEQRSTDAAEVKAFLQSHGADRGLGRWDDDSGQPSTSKPSWRRGGQAKQARGRDEYDADYDRGKQKKVRLKHDSDAMSAPGLNGADFQDAWQQRHGAARGRHEGGRHGASRGRDHHHRGGSSRGREHHRGASLRGRDHRGRGNPSARGRDHGARGGGRESFRGGRGGFRGRSPGRGGSRGRGRG